LTNKISDKDKLDWKDFVSSKDKLPNKDLEFKNKKNLNSRSIDLHGYSLDEANKLIEKFIYKSYSENINKLIVVTGKGLHSSVEKNPYVSKNLSILRYSVPEFISGNQNLMKIINDFQDASIEDGGSGAFYIYLRKKK